MTVSSTSERTIKMRNQPELKAGYMAMNTRYLTMLFKFMVLHLLINTDKI